MKIVCPRMIRGNRGDLASRYGILSQLHELKYKDVTVFCDNISDIAPLPFDRQPYGYLYNLIPKKQGLKPLLQADTILWTGGIDLQDDSSLLKLCHTLLAFLLYRLLGKKIIVAMQGAGPISSFAGKLLVRLIVLLTTAFIVRDNSSLNLLRFLTNNSKKLILGFDGIFCGPFQQTSAISTTEKTIRDSTSEKLLTIGFNIRLWYHFSGSILPYHLQRKSYQDRSKERMQRIIDSSILAVRELSNKIPAKILLVSMYEPGTMIWEDDQPFLSLIKDQCGASPNIQLLEKPLGLQDFCTMMSTLDIMIGMRLHATLIALRFGIPAITLNYTLKGRDIFKDIGLLNYVLELDDFIQNPQAIVTMVNSIRADEKKLKETISAVVVKASNHNRSLLQSLFIQ